MEVYVDLNNVSKLLPAVLDRVTEINWLGDFQGLIQRQIAKQYCFPSMLDNGRFYSLDLISYMPYKHESMEFWITLSKISKGKGIRFLHAYKGKGVGRSGACITPEECKINFTVPSDTTLKIESPKYSKEIRPRILHSFLDSFSLASPTLISNFLLTEKNPYSTGDSGEEGLYRLERSSTLGERREMLDFEKVITDCITDISTKSDDNLSNTSSNNLASVKAALLLILANSSERVDGDWTQSKFAGGNIRVRSPHGMPCTKQFPPREQQSVIW